MLIRYLDVNIEEITKIPTGADLRSWDEKFADNFPIPKELESLVEMYENPEYRKVFDNSFAECITELMRVKEWNSAIINEKTTLDYTRFSQIKKQTSQPEVRTIVTLSMAMQLGMNLTIRLLISAARLFNMESDIDLAYIDLINNHQGKSIPECNQIL